jgi:hypothetical protein
MKTLTQHPQVQQVIPSGGVAVVPARSRRSRLGTYTGENCFHARYKRRERVKQFSPVSGWEGESDLPEKETARPG